MQPRNAILLSAGRFPSVSSAAATALGDAFHEESMIVAERTAGIRFRRPGGREKLRRTLQHCSRSIPSTRAHRDSPPLLAGAEPDRLAKDGTEQTELGVVVRGGLVDREAGLKHLDRRGLGAALAHGTGDADDLVPAAPDLERRDPTQVPTHPALGTPKTTSLFSQRFPPPGRQSRSAASSVAFWSRSSRPHDHPSRSANRTPRGLVSDSTCTPLAHIRRVLRAPNPNGFGADRAARQPSSTKPAARVPDVAK